MLKRLLLFASGLGALIAAVRLLLSAFTTPRDWSTGELVTATIMNTHIRDNLNALKDPPTATYEINEGADYSIVNTSTFTDIDSTDLALVIVTTGGDVELWFTGNASPGAAADRLFFEISEDGVDIGGNDGIFAIIGSSANAPGHNCSFKYLRQGVSAASHTYKLRWKTDGASSWTLYAGAGTANGDTHGQFGARETS